MKVSLIIPAYNEEQRLPEFLESVLSYVKSHPEQIEEIVVVDDGSTDNTTGIASNLAGPNFAKASLGKPASFTGRAAPRVASGGVGSPVPVRVISFPQNQGKGAAVQAGVMAASGDTVVFIDADGATPITELPHMIAALTEADCGFGNRWLSGSHVKKSTPLRHFAGWVNKTYMSLFGLGAIDTTCGFKGFRKTAAKDLFTNLQEKRWLFDTEVAYKALRRGYSIKNFPIEWESKAGSKLDSATLVKSAFQILPLIMRIRSHE